jgi:hypothetical protein
VGLKDVEEHEELVCELLGSGRADGWQISSEHGHCETHGRSDFWRGKLKSDSELEIHGKLQ